VSSRNRNPRLALALAGVVVGVLSTASLVLVAVDGGDARRGRPQERTLAGEQRAGAARASRPTEAAPALRVADAPAPSRVEPAAPDPPRGAHPDRDDTKEWLAVLASSNDPRALAGAVRALTRLHALNDPEVQRALASLGNDPSPARRAAGLRALGALPAPDASRVEMLAAAVSGDPEPAVRAAAAEALGAVADRDATLARATNAALVDASTADPDARVRYEATQAIHLGAAPPAVVGALEALMRDDRDAAVRQAAIQTLGDASAAESASVRASLEAQLAQETHPALRKSLLASIVRTGRADAIPSLETIAAASPDLAGDAQDFLAALETGATDMDAIWKAKVQFEVTRLGPSRGVAPKNH
jgi:hypothetical protein